MCVKWPEQPQLLKEKLIIRVGLVIVFENCWIMDMGRPSRLDTTHCDTPNPEGHFFAYWTSLS